MATYTHLTKEQRNTIELLLNQEYQLKIIAEIVNKDARTISKEIKRNRYLVVRKNAANTCGVFNSCQKQRLCNTCEMGYCKFCNANNCSTLCENYTSIPDCKTTNRFPYVCNACDEIKECKLPKLFYKAETAQDNYCFNVSDHKKGSKLSADILKDINEKVKAGVDNNLSLDVIINAHQLPISLSSLYNIIHLNLLETRDIDLKRKVSFKKRYNNKSKSTDLIYDYLKDRTYTDYLNYIEKHKDINIWQMDTIEGVKGKDEHAVLSLLHTKSNLQLFIKIYSITQKEVIKALNNIKKYLGPELFKETFELILTDNGKEFKDPISMAKDLDTDEVLTKIFYCESRRSDQKGGCEKNHTIFRECLPKGISINPYTINDINYISNQVNNYIRKKFNYISPFQSASRLLDQKVLELNELNYIAPHLVKLNKIIK